MRYLRMLSNSLAAGALATAYVVALVLQLNPALGLDLPRLMPLVTTVGLFYLVHLTTVFYVMLVIRQLFASEVFSPAWISIGVLASLGAAASAAGAAIMWANMRAFSLVLDDATREALAKGATALVASSAMFVFIASMRARYGRQARAVCTVLGLATAVGSAAAPLALRAAAPPTLLEAHSIATPSVPATSARPPRITVVAIDAGSLDLITTATAEGRLPNFGRILDAGTMMHMASVRPTSAEAVWTAVATGKLPQKNGVRSSAVYRVTRGGESIRLLPDYCYAHGLLRFGFITEEPLTSAAVRSRSLWTILSGLGIPVGVVAWPLTDPVTPVQGYLVSERFHRVGQTPSAIEESSAAYPPDILAEAIAAFDDVPAGEAATLVASGVDSRHDSAGRIDRGYDRVARELAREHPVQVAVVRYQSLDPIGHYYLRYAAPSAFGDVTDEERRRFGQVLERHYQLIDDAIGRAIGSLGPDDLLLVLSGYGMEPLGVPRRILERVIGDPELSGTHDDAPDGFLIAYGATVAKSRPLARASVVDVVPTVLYFLGLPVGRDMDGYARTDIFQRSFTDDRPITFIPTYEQ